MQEAMVLTDDNLDSVLAGDKPIMVLISDGEGIRSDFISAFRKAQDEQADIIFAKLDPTTNPKAAERFSAGSKPLLIGWYCGETVVRRSKPWGTDMPLALEQVNERIAAINPPREKETESNETAPQTKAPTVVDTKPVEVTDDTFQAEVIDFELPVMVDFWAEWCGPCKMVAPILDKLAQEYAGKVRIAKVDVDSNPGLSQTFRVQSIPTLMMIKNRTIVFSQPGALPEPALRSLIDQLIELDVPDPEDQNTPPEN